MSGDTFLITVTEQVTEIGVSITPEQPINVTFFDIAIPTNETLNQYIQDVTQTAQNAATAAQTSEANAAISASAANTSESNAADSEASAAAAAITAQSAVDSIIWNDVVFITSANSPYSIADSHKGKLISVDASGGAVTISLPEISTLDLSNPWSIAVKKTDSSANAITINRASTDLIDGATSKTISDQNSGATLIPDIDPNPDGWTSCNFGLQGVTPVANGGTGQSSLTANNVILGNGTSGVQFVAPGTSGNVLQSNGSSWVSATPTKAISNTSISTTYSILSTDELVLASASGGAFTATLPTAVGVNGKVYYLKKTDSTFNQITIATTSSQTIDGVSTKKLSTQYEVISLVSDGANWQVLERRIPANYASFTPTGSWSSNVTYTGVTWRQDGFAYYDINIAISGAPTSATLTINLLSGHTVDTARLSQTSASRKIIGFATWWDNSLTAAQTGVIVYSTTTTVAVLLQRLSSAANHDLAPTSLTVPKTWAASDNINIQFSVPVVGWEG